MPERKHNSIRSNRIDGEALAYLQALNDELEAIPAPRVKARLVTRAMTLINAARKATPRIEFLRHPRLLALNRSVASGPTADREAANAPGPRIEDLSGATEVRRRLAFGL